MASRQRNAPGRTRLFLGEVGAAVTANVSHRSDSRMSVRHALPFLRLESEVMDEEGRFARIAAVRVEVEENVPTLHLELVYPQRKRARERRDATLPYAFGVDAAPAPVLHRSELRDAPNDAHVAASEDDTIVFPTAAACREDAALAVRPRTWIERVALAVRGLLARIVRRLEPSLS
jgi:hypothetical protein